MKAYIIQPYYSLNGKEDIDKCYRDMLKLMDECDQGADIIVLPESCHCQAYMGSNQLSFKTKERLNADFDKKVRETAMRCKALVFANYGYKGEDGLWRNVTYGVDKNGKTVAEYFKAHPAPSEVNDEYMNSDYSYEYREPYVVTIDGVRYGFMTCYDFYMYENFAPLARKGVDVIIGCSHQRSDTHQALEIIGRFLSYNTNAYLLRSSVSLGEDSPICGCSMAVAPDGTMLGNLKSKIGILKVDFDPTEKYYKKKGFYGTELVPHYKYIDDGRRPWLYRQGGSAMVAQDKFMNYPRVCAHRGFNAVAPENSMPALGAAVALGAEEIEFDLWMTKDGELVSVHDPLIDRTSSGNGKVIDYTINELKQFDFGEKAGESFKGLEIMTFEDVLKKFSCHTIMNIHVKECEDGRKRERVQKIVNLLYQYDAEQHAYIMSSDDELHQIFMEIAPEIRRCMGAKLGGQEWNIVDDAIKNKCQKVQLYKPYFNQEMIDKAHDNGIICNVFYADDMEEAKRYLDMGIDVILTNDYLKIARAVKEWKSRR
ncbi:MAG: hypothetical protein IJD54_02235 [Clostridia bacterium]|nr:hypothetical protein [Clostridia bacterium]